jgi:6-phospho-beta-glucosidase
MPAEKIAIIGGGSAYVPGVLAAFTTTADALAGSEIALMDIDPTRLPTMTAIGRRMVAESGAPLTISSTTRLEEALRGATFVLTNFRPGGLEGLRLDEAIPDRAGVLGQETTGPGGTAFALRSVPQVLDLCRQMEAVCPDAWLINYTNPANFVADAIRRRSPIRFVSLCDGGGNGLRYAMPELLELDRDEVRVRAIGINHHTWVVELRIGRKDGYPRLRDFARRFENPPAGADRRTRFKAFGAWMLDRYGVWPGNESYLYPYFHYQEALADFHAGHSLYQLFMTDLPEHWRRFEAMAGGSAPIHLDSAMHHTNVGHGDIAVQVMVAIATNETQEFHVNVPNEGAIANLPRGAIVEVPALVDASGVRPLCMGELPKGVVGLTRALLAWQELSVDATLTGDRDLVVQALLAHPWIDSVSVAERLCDELLAAHAPYLPQFAETAAMAHRGAA